MQANGLRLRLLEAGEGPLVVLLHGFPELAYSWRHQLGALAQAGYRAVAPDQRGYGGSDCPEAIDAYDIFSLVADAVGLVAALGETRAALVGHDWGAPVAWHCALLRPDLFDALALVSIPYRPRSWGATRPTDAMRRAAGDRQFYQLYFQEPGRAEAAFERDVRAALLRMYYAASGEAPPGARWQPFSDGDDAFTAPGSGEPLPLPGWLSEPELRVFVEAFGRTGFRGGLNWYRNIDRNWERSAFLAGAPIRQPSLFIAGEADPAFQLNRAAYEALERAMPGLTRKAILPGAGHWLQQERPAEVNALLLEFLSSLPGGRR